MGGAAGGSSPLHAAVAAGAGPAVELLMAYGADGSARNAEGNTALELAAAAMRTTLGRGTHTHTRTHAHRHTHTCTHACTLTHVLYIFHYV